MRVDRLMAAAFMAAVASSAVFAQPKPASPQPTTPAPATSSAAVPATKVALINTEAFADEKQGIVRIIAAIKRVEAEFQPRKTELQQLNQRLQQLAEDIKKTENVADPKATQQKVEQLEQLKKEAQRKQEDAQAAYNKQVQVIMEPIYRDIGTSLDAFGKARGITLLLDSSKIAPAILAAADATDVTLAFIAEFNSKYPATAAVTPPR
ncbi:MAG TPA: OmpH family outer membrane protein [Pyrinomonadaceae bacterium]|nr:OmpH family outer membrane protein [Pyrinomonadaceae bacterium]